MILFGLFQKPSLDLKKLWNDLNTCVYQFILQGISLLYLKLVYLRWLLENQQNISFYSEIVNIQQRYKEKTSLWQDITIWQVDIKICHHVVFWLNLILEKPDLNPPKKALFIFLVIFCLVKCVLNGFCKYRAFIKMNANIVISYCLVYNITND